MGFLTVVKVALVLPETSASSLDWIGVSPEGLVRVVTSSLILLGGSSGTASEDDMLVDS